MRSEIYFIQSGRAGWIKVGVAIDVAKRLSQLQCGNPEQLRLLATVPGGRREEARLHHILRREKQRSEWFENSPVVQSLVRKAVGGNFDTADVEAMADNYWASYHARRRAVAAASQFARFRKAGMDCATESASRLDDARVADAAARLTEAMSIYHMRACAAMRCAA